MIAGFLKNILRSFIVSPFEKGYKKALKGKHEKAIEYYTKAINKYPEPSAALNNRGMSKAALLRHEEAIEDYDNAIKLNPDFSDA